MVSEVASSGKGAEERLGMCGNFGALTIGSQKF
jgi:hypothetical protein